MAQGYQKSEIEIKKVRLNEIETKKVKLKQKSEIETKKVKLGITLTHFFQSQFKNIMPDVRAGSLESSQQGH